MKKTIISIFIALLTNYLPAQNNNSQQLKFNQDGFLTINDKPTLMIGWYSATLPNSEEMTKELAENGFNIIRIRDFCLYYPERYTAELDRFHKYGLYGWASLEYVTYKYQNKERLTKLVTHLKDHPALLGWEIQDEIVWHIWLKNNDWVKNEQPKELNKLIEQKQPALPEQKISELKKMLEDAKLYMNRGLEEKAEKLYDKIWVDLGKQPPALEKKLSGRQTNLDSYIQQLSENRKTIKDIAPNQFIIANHAPRNSIKTLKKLNPFADVISCDIYPAPEYRTMQHGDLKNKTLSCVGEYTTRMKTVAEGRPVWMILQGFGWRDLQKTPCRNSDDKEYGRRPNFDELNFMVYDAIVNGANGILYWGMHYADYVDEDNQLKKDLLKVSKRLRALEPAIVGEKPSITPTITIGEIAGSVDGLELQPMLRKTEGGQWVLIISNTTPYSIPFTVADLPDSLNNQKIHLLYTNQTQEIKDCKFEDGIKGYGVNIYATSRIFETK